ncbi:hypothetical protein, partial [Enterococcus faecium]|uniref:hypothetical protein n=1 Tax=Enterococcus faecium TaxID=1352 RepID=UPI0039FC582A
MAEGSWPNYFNPIKTQLLNLHALCRHLNTSPLSLAINYATNIKEVDKVIIGVNNEVQLIEILSCL